MSKATNAQTRVCGGCTACCKTPDIDTPDFKKPLGIWCEHCNIGRGCKIYENRPLPCRTFVCQWLLGTGSEAERPDRAGFMLDFVSKGGIAEVNTAQIFEVKVGRLDHPKVREWTRRSLASDMIVIHRYLSSRSVVFVPKTLEGEVDTEGFEIGSL